MARNIRGAFSLASNAMAGPSRLHPQAFHPPSHLSRRSINIGGMIPSWFRSKEERTLVEATERRAAEKRRAQAEAQGLTPTSTSSATSNTTAESAPDAQTTSIFGEMEEGSEQRPTNVGDESIFAEDKAKDQARTNKKHHEHWYTSARHKISYKKLKLLAHQIKGLPIDEAILQMQFSVKGASKWIKPNLALAKQHAIFYKNMRAERLVVSEAVVNKDMYGPKQTDIKARGRSGVKRHPYCRLKFVLRESKPMEDIVAARFKKDVDRHARSAARQRDWQPLRRKTMSGWAW